MKPSRSPEHSAPKKSPWKKSGTGLILGLSLGVGILLLALRIALWAAFLMGSALPLAQPELPFLPSWEESTPPDDNQQEELEVQAGCAVSGGTYRLTCEEYVDALEEVLSRFYTQEVAFQEDASRCYRLYLDGEETQLLLLFYQGDWQVGGIEPFHTVEVVSVDEMAVNSVGCYTCASALYLVDSTMDSHLTALQFMVDWVESWQEYPFYYSGSGALLSQLTHDDIVVEANFNSQGWPHSLRFMDRTDSGY